MRLLVGEANTFTLPKYLRGVHSECRIRRPRKLEWDGLVE